MFFSSKNETGKPFFLWVDLYIKTTYHYERGNHDRQHGHNLVLCHLQIQYTNALYAALQFPKNLNIK